MSIRGGPCTVLYIRWKEMRDVITVVHLLYTAMSEARVLSCFGEIPEGTLPGKNYKLQCKHCKACVPTCGSATSNLITHLKVRKKFLCAY